MTNKEHRPSRRKSPSYLMLRKFIWGPGPTVPVPFTGGMSVSVGYGDEEVRSGDWPVDNESWRARLGHGRPFELCRHILGESH